MQAFFWFLAFINLALFGLLAIGVAVGVLPVVFGFTASMLCLLLCSVSAFLADRSV